MPSVVYTDVDEFADVICGAAGRFIPTALSSAEWRIDQIPVPCLQIQVLQVGAPATYAGIGRPDRVSVAFPLASAATIRINGRSLSDDQVLSIHGDNPLTYACASATSWALISLPPGWCSDEEPGRPLRANEVTTRVGAAAIGRLRGLINALQIENAGTVSNPGFAEAEAEVQELILRMLSMNPEQPNHSCRTGRPALCRDRIMAHCWDLFASGSAHPVSVAQLAKAASVTDRTLRTVFYEYFGMGPIQLLRLRRLHEERRKLLLADRSSTVAEIIGPLAVWEAGQFARQYKALYGELPSHTLSRSPHRPVSIPAPNSKLMSWRDYAAQCFESPAVRSV